MTPDLVHLRHGEGQERRLGDLRVDLLQLAPDVIPVGVSRSPLGATGEAPRPGREEFLDSPAAEGQGGHTRLGLESPVDPHQNDGQGHPGLMPTLGQGEIAG